MNKFFLFLLNFDKLIYYFYNEKKISQITELGKRKYVLKNIKNAASEGQNFVYIYKPISPKDTVQFLTKLGYTVQDRTDNNHSFHITWGKESWSYPSDFYKMKMAKEIKK